MAQNPDATTGLLEKHRPFARCDYTWRVIGMSFNSLSYFLFLPLVFLLYCSIGTRYRWFVLLLASISFYAALRVPYLMAVLVSVTAVTYAAGILLGRIKNDQIRSMVFWCAVSTNILILAGLKYLPFLSMNLNYILDYLHPGFTVPISPSLVAIGVSFYVLQAISYLTDIYWEISEPEAHIGYFSLSLMFFPKLLQGPIERSSDLLPQLRATFVFNEENVRSGLMMFAVGLFKKVVIADRLGLYVNIVYGNVHAYSGVTLILATYMYALQIYFDFSGYTDMALGSARIFNIQLTQNFNAPYFATSIADFWRRWHITLSRWILEYIFKPLQIQWRDWRQAGTAAALIVTFLVSGIWHGASWCFVVWGGLHGLYLSFSLYYRPVQKAIHKRLGLENTRALKLWQCFFTFHLVCFAWIFFRAKNLDDAIYVVTHLLDGIHGMRSFLLTNGDTDLLTLVMVIFCFMLVQILSTCTRLGRSFAVWPTWCRWSVYYALLFSIVLFNVDSERAFIYMQF